MDEGIRGISRGGNILITVSFNGFVGDGIRGDEEVMACLVLRMDIWC